MFRIRDSSKPTQPVVHFTHAVVAQFAFGVQFLAEVGGALVVLALRNLILSINTKISFVTIPELLRTLLLKYTINIFNRYLLNAE